MSDVDADVMLLDWNGQGIAVHRVFLPEVVLPIVEHLAFHRSKTHTPRAGPVGQIIYAGLEVLLLGNGGNPVPYLSAVNKFN